MSAEIRGPSGLYPHCVATQQGSRLCLRPSVVPKPLPMSSPLFLQPLCLCSVSLAPSTALTKCHPPLPRPAVTEDAERTSGPAIPTPQGSASLPPAPGSPVTAVRSPGELWSTEEQGGDENPPFPPSGPGL